MGPAFKGLIPMNPLPARRGGSLRNSLLGNRSGAVSVRLLQCHIFPWSSQAGGDLPSATQEGLGSCRSPNANPCPTRSQFSRSTVHPYSTSRCSGPRSGSKRSWWGLEMLPGRQSPLDDLIPVSSLQIHGHSNSQGACLGASHAHLCMLAPSFRGSPLLTPPGKESWGLCSQLRALGFSG